MIQKRIILKRKLRGIFTYLIFSFFLCVGVFALFFGIWFFFKAKIDVLTPLPKTVASTKSTMIVSSIEIFCREHAIPCANIVVQNDATAIFTVDSDEQVILSLQKDLAVQLSSLQLTIAHLTIEGKRFRRLDFRFDKPVISYK